MASIRFGQKKTLWSQSGPTPRLLFGAFLIGTVALFGLTPKTLFGLSIAWPYASLWGAVGWGRVGLSLRPMLILIAFGLVQDISFNAPLGCFVIVNLGVYGLSALIADTFDVFEPLVAIIAPTLLFSAGMFFTWFLASSLQDHAVRVTPLIMTLFTTGILYVGVHRVFNLGRRPGEMAGRAT